MQSSVQPPRAVLTPRSHSLWSSFFILLSFFDGIATAALAVQDLQLDVKARISWEWDDECMAVSSHHFPDMQHRGNFELDTVDAILATLKEIDPHYAMHLIVTAAPPCPDYSRIRGINAPGRSGEEGRKFDAWVALYLQLEARCGRRVFLIVENVIPSNPDDAWHFAERLQAQCIVVDASDFGLISRPRLWWLRIDWTQAPSWLTSSLSWSTMRGLDRLHVPFSESPSNEAIPVPYGPSPHDLDSPQERLHSDILQGLRMFPCLTTPAKTAAGRPVPTGYSQRHDDATWQRWAADHQQYGPWNYEAHCLTQSPDGDLHIPSPELKERLHMLPQGYTGVAGASAHSRQFMLGNGWHFGVARFVIALVLTVAQGVPVAVPRTPHTRPVVQAAQRFLVSGTPFGPTWYTKSRPLLVDEPDDAYSHLRLALDLEPILPRLRGNDPGLLYAIAVADSLQTNVSAWRDAIIQDVGSLVDEFHDATSEWEAQLPLHVHQAYTGSDLPGTGNRRTQVLVMCHLLDLFEYPDARQLREDLTIGFQMLGTIPPGVGWEPRNDDYYTDPMSIPELSALNDAYIANYLVTRSPDKDHDIMLKEILDEVRLGRMEGPFTAPDHWPRRAVAPEGMRLMDIPTQTPLTACAFAIHQIGSDGKPKVRRGEDWRRSLHNRTIHVTDKPNHHTVDSYISSASAMATASSAALLWGHDHDGAYRQCPLRDPNDAYVMLLGPDGPTIWRHRVLLFGAVSSVWGYNRFGDALVFLARSLLAIAALHYVDDYGGAEPPDRPATVPQETATVTDDLRPLNRPQSAFRGFALLNSILGWMMKPSKAQYPASAHRIQGVQLRLMADRGVVSPLPHRTARVVAMIDSALETNNLCPNTAAELGGKSAFLATTTYGRIGRAPTKPVYARQHSHKTQKSRNDKLTIALRAALHCLKYILTSATPRIVPFRHDNTAPGIIYADAFFDMGDRRFKPSDDDIPEAWDPRACQFYKNGWGAVIFSQPDDQNRRFHFCIRGEVPPQVVAKFCSRKAYIYFLETWAQVVTSLAFGNLLGSQYAAFVDNEASKYALIKGFGRDEAINSLIGMYWCYHADSQKFPWLERVSSKANISDEISRDEFGIVDALGCQFVHLDYTQAYEILLRAAADIEYAHSSAHKDLAESLQSQVASWRSKHPQVPKVVTVPEHTPSEASKGPTVTTWDTGAARGSFAKKTAFVEQGRFDNDTNQVACHARH